MSWIESLQDRLEKAGSRGLWVVVAYGWAGRELGACNIGFMTCAIDNFPDAVAFLARESHHGYDFNFGQSVPLNEMQDLCSRFSALRLWEVQAPDFDPNQKDDIIKLRETCARYAAARWLERGVALIDICGFTKLSSTQQLCQLLSLDRALRTALLRLRAASAKASEQKGYGLPLRFCRSTMGDGYYLWSEVWGRHGDAALLALLLQTLSVVERRRTEPREDLLCVRAAFTVGEVYWVYDRGLVYTQEPVGHYIVGPATNYLARVLGAAQPSQMLVGDFARLHSRERGDMIGPAELLDEATEMLTLDLPEDLGKQTEWAFQPTSTIRVIDKHGDTHYCYNLRARVANWLDREDANTQFVQAIGLELDEVPAIDALSFRPPRD